MAAKMYWLVSYVLQCGEREFSRHTMLHSSKAGLSRNMHRYFWEFYPDDSPSEYVMTQRYEYCGCEVIIKDIRSQEVTEEQAKMLVDLKVAFL